MSPGCSPQFKPDDTRYMLAAHVTGPAETAFPDGPPKPPEPAPSRTKPRARLPKSLKQSAQPINVVVVADTDMLDDRFWAQTAGFLRPAGRRADRQQRRFRRQRDRGAGRRRGSGRAAQPRHLGAAVRGRRADPARRRRALRRRAAGARRTSSRRPRPSCANLTGGEPADASAPPSPEQTKAIEQFRADMVTTRQRVARGAGGAARRTSSRLKTILEFFDIALIPIIVAAAALVLGALRLRRGAAAARRRPEAAAMQQARLPASGRRDGRRWSRSRSSRC